MLKVNNLIGFGNRRAAGGGSDPFFANVKLLLGFEGTDGSTTTTDEAPSPHAVTFNGNAQIDTAQFKFGSSSCLFDGTGDYLTIPDSADWDLSDANSDLFTIEFWIRPHGNVGNQRVMGQAPSSGNWSWDINSTWSGGNGSVQFRYTSDGSSPTTIGTGTANLAIDTWHFIAVSKNASGKIRIWRNGTLDDSATPANSAIFNSTGTFDIGRNFATANLDGWMDEIRITKGACRYDTDGSITVPTAAFPRS
ncbi:LamG domain-containing protein [Mesorhizobium neociceri]|uniref:LamG domain-containing protein n=1 Tax=Mesorhizobium neociceri TaxID=1307853 RepID=A0A838B5U4_9HYPH|nr:LamG domain-containing protein [Mesorhizobium neociceri]MBA1141765.1 LamG domain-containing protein [Mesorhizobium neociceri]